MGNILWNKALSTKEQLEEIQNEIDTIETFKLRASVQEKNSILKKKILSKVQETETFNEARLILEKYDPQALRNMSVSLQNLSSIDPSSDRQHNSHSRMAMPVTSPPRSRSYSRPNGPGMQQQTPVNNQQQRSGINIIPQPIMATGGPVPQTPMTQARTVRPILPPERSVVEKVVDYMFSDGPESRYALICFQCRRHNGMALQDEFEYMSYCCAYCGYFNPARKSRPQPPAPAPVMAIEASKEPRIEEPEDREGPKIEEIDSVLNKTVNATSTRQSFTGRSSSTSRLRKRERSNDRSREHSKERSSTFHSASTTGTTPSDTSDDERRHHDNNKTLQHSESKESLKHKPKVS